MYIRLEISSIPCEFVTNFDPHYPIILGGLTSGEGNVGYLQVGHLLPGPECRRLLSSSLPKMLTVQLCFTGVSIKWCEALRVFFPWPVVIAIFRSIFASQYLQRNICLGSCCGDGTTAGDTHDINHLPNIKPSSAMSPLLILCCTLQQQMSFGCLAIV